MVAPTRNAGSRAGLVAYRIESPDVSNRVSGVAGCPIRGHDFRGPETKSPKSRACGRVRPAETRPHAEKPPTRPLPPPTREISVRSQVRGGPGRTRTSN